MARIVDINNRVLYRDRKVNNSILRRDQKYNRGRSRRDEYRYIVEARGNKYY